MESRGSKGYVLPGNVAPEGMICLKVYIPDDPLYLAAFSGAYERLGTWQVWEKDGTTRASQAAQHWKDVIDFTRQNGWIGGCNEMTPECCDALIEAINRLSTTINISNQYCCSTENTWKLPEGWEENHPVTDDPQTGEPPSLPSGDLCDAAYQTHYDTRYLIANFAELTLQESPYEGLLAIIATLATAAFPSSGTLFALLAQWSSSAYGFITGDSLEFWDSLQQEYVCQFIMAESGIAFEQWLQEYIAENAPNLAVRLWLFTVVQMFDYSGAMAGEYDIAPEFIGSDCSVCMSLDVPPLPTGWYIEPLLSTDILDYAYSDNTEEITLLSHTINEFGAVQLIGGAPRVESLEFDDEAVKARINAPGEIERRGIMIRYTFHTADETESDTNINQNISAGNYGSNARMGWTNTNRFQVRGLGFTTDVIEAFENHYDQVKFLAISTPSPLPVLIPVTHNQAGSSSRFLIWLVYKDAE